LIHWFVLDLHSDMAASLDGEQAFDDTHGRIYIYTLCNTSI